MQLSRREFFQRTATFAGISMIPGILHGLSANSKVGIAFIGVGGRGKLVLENIASHPMAEVVSLCDIDRIRLEEASLLYPGSKTFADYREMLHNLDKRIDAVVVATPDHTHAPASILAMSMGKHVYCEKPLTHGIEEAYKMASLARRKQLHTQMGTQLHSTNAYRMLARFLQDGVIGKVERVYTWSHKSWGYDGPAPSGADPVPANIDWNLWLGTAAERPYLEGKFHPGQWRRTLDFGCGTLGDMGVHMFDPIMTSLALDQPKTVLTSCRKPNGYSHPMGNTVEYSFKGTPYTAPSVKYSWFDGTHAPTTDTDIEDLKLPEGRDLPKQGTMFVGEDGQRILLPHGSGPVFLPVELREKLVKPKLEPLNHYHLWVDAILGKGKCNVDFDYAKTLSCTVLLGTVGNRFPGRELGWDAGNMRFTNCAEANGHLKRNYRNF